VTTSADQDTHLGPDGLRRCWWSAGSDELRRYHDTEWGFAVRDDRHLFEKICLEAFQTGLSWALILNKRPRFRAVFHDFAWPAVAAMSPADVERLMGDAGIVRNRRKIEATIHNARLCGELIEAEGSLAEFVWRYVDEDRPAVITRDWAVSRTTSPASHALAADLRRRGWKFVGPTTMYAFLQSMGVANDHVAGCHCRTGPPPN